MLGVGRTQISLTFGQHGFCLAKLPHCRRNGPNVGSSTYPHQEKWYLPFITIYCYFSLYTGLCA